MITGEFWKMTRVNHLYLSVLRYDVGIIIFFKLFYSINKGGEVSFSLTSIIQVKVMKNE